MKIHCPAPEHLIEYLSKRKISIDPKIERHLKSCLVCKALVKEFRKPSPLKVGFDNYDKLVSTKQPLKIEFGQIWRLRNAVGKSRLAVITQQAVTDDLTHLTVSPIRLSADKEDLCPEYDLCVQNHESPLNCWFLIEYWNNRSIDKTLLEICFGKLETSICQKLSELLSSPQKNIEKLPLRVLWFRNKCKREGDLLFSEINKEKYSEPFPVWMVSLPENELFTCDALAADDKSDKVAEIQHFASQLERIYFSAKKPPFEFRIERLKRSKLNNSIDSNLGKIKIIFQKVPGNFIQIETRDGTIWKKAVKNQKVVLTRVPNKLKGKVIAKISILIDI